MIDTRRGSLYFAVLTCAGAVALLPGCTASSSGTRHRTTPLRYGLSARNYLLHVPPNYDQQKVWPLILVLHGAFSTAHTMEKWSGFSILADREGFIVAYPNGIGVFGWLQHWNAGHCCGLAEMDHVDDVKFLDYVIGEISSEFHIDPHRIYVVGHSNGAMLAYRFATESRVPIAGIGVVAGSIGSSKGADGAVYQTGPPEIPVSLIAIHGREDRSVPFEGGGGLYSLGRHYISVINSVGLWAGYCGCTSSPEVYEDRNAGRRILVWQNSEGDPRVVLDILNDWDHAWPGAVACRRLSRNHPLRTFEASQVIWDFFCGRLPRVAAIPSSPRQGHDIK